MKYNPKINEVAASQPGFTNIHPMQPVESVPGALEVLAQVQTLLCEITGFDEITLQPLAGAHGELTCLMLIKAYHESLGETGRTVILLPDRAHGTNPASAAACGFSVRSIATNGEGNTDMEALRAALGPDVAAEAEAPVLILMASLAMACCIVLHLVFVALLARRLGRPAGWTVQALR